MLHGQNGSIVILACRCIGRGLIVVGVLVVKGPLMLRISYRFIIVLIRKMLAFIKVSEYVSGKFIVVVCRFIPCLCFI